MISPQHCPREAGFSLLEMIVALAVLGLLTVLLAGGLQLGSHLWAAQDRRLAASDATDAVHAALRTMIQDAQPLPLAGLGERGAAAFIIGEPHSLDFVTELPDGFGRAGYCDVAIVLAGDGRLMIRWRPHARDARTAAPVRETELLRRVAGLDFAYFILGSGDTPAHWEARWVRPGAVPALIRLRLRFVPGDPRVWRDVVVSPAAGVPGA
ncbi:MAG: prepilin-type N-terminal cleavage/methylation domain-containing protein [Alphaproteobacteria bacterium]|nr:prepilin-type N-terminal cleavage/methylation domain-containing protein [Alphaproteobacteria bacterium]